MTPNSAPAPEALMESVVFEDGLAAAVEAAEAGVGGHDPVALQLAVLRLVAGNLAGRLASEDPFGAAEDPYVAGTEPLTGPAGFADLATGADLSDLSEVDRWEQVVAGAHAVVNQVGAVRAHGVAEFARWGSTAAGPLTFGQHRLGHRDEGAADILGPVLGLGPYEADRLVDESVWMTARTPALLADAAAGEANLATVAAVAAELQDARPETCELVQEAVLRRGVHRKASRVSARRSARTLVEGVEAAAARVTRKRTTAQQVGVWLDPHPTPGLALLSAALPAADAEALMSAVEERATRTHRDNGGDGRLLGQHRAAALIDLALANVTFTAHLEVVTAGHEPTVEREPVPTPRSLPAGERGELAWQRLREAPVVLTATVGAVPGEALAAVLAAHAAPARGAITMTVAGPRSPLSGPGEPVTATNGYRPAKVLRDLVVRRDRRCRFPGCHRPARYADLDHVRPWPHGPTSASNLQCLCRRHHRAKQRGWSVLMTPAGECTWTSPTGREHTTLPGRTHDLADLTDIARTNPSPQVVA